MIVAAAWTVIVWLPEVWVRSVSSTAYIPRAQYTWRQITDECDQATTQPVKMLTSGYLTLYIRSHILRVEYSDRADS